MNKYELHPDFPREEWRRKYYNEEKGYYECYFCGEMAYPGGPFEWKDGSDGFKYIWLIEPPRCLDCDAELSEIEMEEMGYDPRARHGHPKGRAGNGFFGR